MKLSQMSTGSDLLIGWTKVGHMENSVGKYLRIYGADFNKIKTRKHINSSSSLFFKKIADSENVIILMID